MSLSAKAQQEIQAALESLPSKGIPGGVFVAVDKKGEYLTKQAAGVQALGDSKPMSEDSVFWIASCTKMITGIACMQLHEQGKLDLDDAKALYSACPELEKKKVLVSKDGKMEDRKGDITVRRLLTHTAGFGYTFFNEKLRDFGRPTGWEEFSGDAEDCLDLPLVNQPGKAWEYGVNIDWAGLAVMRVSGLTLDEYFKKNIFEPLGITDLSFRPTQHMLENLVGMTQRLPDGHTEMIDHPHRRAIYLAQGKKADSIFHAGGHGCFAKPKEYCKIIAALLNDGASPTTGNRILKAESVAEMFKNQVPEFPDHGRQGTAAAKPLVTNPLPDFYPQPGNPPQGWGLTFHMTIEPTAHGRGANTVWWAGIGNLFWFCDREKGVGGMIASQIYPFGDMNVLGAWVGCEKAVYDSLKG